MVHFIALVACLFDYCAYICSKCVIYCTMRYGTIIKERRAVLNLTQQDLADYTGLSLRLIKSIEADQGNPTLSSMEKIADILGMEIVWKIKEVSA